jgi:hypothetical protein
MRVGWRALVVLVLLSVASGFADLRMRSYPARSYSEFIPKVVAGSADAPERYRVLVPFTVEAFRTVTGLGPAGAWHTTRLILFFLGYLTFFVYLRTWFSPSFALLGTAIVAGTWPLTLTNSWAHPDHVAELVLFTAGCMAIARQQTGMLVLVLAVATLNRETAVFLVPTYLLSGVIRPARVVTSALLGGVWLAIYGGLRLWRGAVGYDYFQFARNVDFLRLLPENYDPYYRAYGYFALLLFGGLLAVAVHDAAPRDTFITRALWVVPLFGAVAFSISSIIETRIFTPLYPLIMPAVMSALASADTLRRPATTPTHHE